MRKFVFLSCLVMLCIITQLVFFIYVVRTYDQRVSRFRVEEKLFRSAVEYSCTNFLTSYIVDLTNSTSTVENTPTIDVKKVDLSTWGDLSGVLHCMIDGLRYSVGDYTPFGLIVQISDGRVYCRNGFDIVILRAIPKYDRASRPRPGAPEGAPGEDEERGAL